jgi:RP/EB family microtubule-associated protein
MSDDPSAIGLQHPAFAVSKAVLLDWLNTVFGLSYVKVEECSSGAVYCQILDAIYPGQVPMKTVKWNAKNEYDWVANFKIAQKVMTAQNVAKPLPIDKLVKGKYQDNLEFLQWFKHYFECRFGGQPYDAAGRRALGVGGAASGIGGGAPKPAPRAAVAAPVKKPTPTVAVKKVTPAASPKPKAETTSAAKVDGGEQKEKLLAQISELEAQMVGFEKERDFYFGKLREVEIFCQNANGEEFSKDKVVAILYKSDETEGEPAASTESEVEATAAAVEEPEETF